ncbi:TonB family protein [Ruegeria sp. SCPT10]|uniref:energy transducer TonB n=1 Tax=Ruegeria sp. SCP10 TaxID=3141377 RepID=UPI00333B4E17
MIPRSRAIAALAILLAAATHSVALYDFRTDEPVLVEGGGSVETAALGSSFKDFVAGTVASESAEAQQEPVEPDQQAQKAEPETQATASAAPSVAQTVPTMQAALSATATQTSRPLEKPEAKKPVAEPATEPETPPVQKPEPEKKKAPKTPAKAGNADQDQNKGATTGKTAKGAATAQSATRTASAQGNAEASNYAGQVKRRILQARRKSVNIKGSVLITFRIADNGALQSAQIKRSSGSKRLDQVALAQIRAAAPFPVPPPSARRQYTLEIKGK